jgi:hypothetical protein
MAGKNKKSWIFLISFASIGTTLIVLLGILLFAFYRRQREGIGRELRLEQEVTASLQKRFIGMSLRKTTGDLLFLKDHFNSHYGLHGEDQFYALLQNDYFYFSKWMKVYDQIRYIDETGMEQARINYSSGSPVVVPPEKLQDKSGRYYFRESIGLSEGEIYFSPLDLNVENGRVETPRKPMIRLATPVFTPAGEKAGIVVLNYLAEEVIERLRSLQLNDDMTRTLLLNSGGYALYSENGPEKEFTFMFPDRAQCTLYAAMPEIAEDGSSREQGIIEGKRGI